MLEKLKIMKQVQHAKRIPTKLYPLSEGIQSLVTHKLNFMQTKLNFILVIF